MRRPRSSLRPHSRPCSSPPLGRRLALGLLVLLVTPGCDEPEPAEPAGPERSVEPIEVRLRVRTAEVQLGALGDLGEATGLVEPFALARVAAETGGRVNARLVDRGSSVAAGDRLVELDASRARIEVQRADASLAARGTDLAQAERERERADRLRERESMAAAQADRAIYQAESAKAAEELARLSKRAAADLLRDSKVNAPFAGLIADFHVEVGDYVGPGTPLVTLVDLSRVRVRVGVTAAEARELSVGDRLAVRFGELGGKPMIGELHSISPLADPRSGTYAAELWLDNPADERGDRALRQGMVGRVSLRPVNADGTPSAGPSSRESLLIPRSAVLRRDGQLSVWVVGEGKAHARAVVLGRSDLQHVEVLEGLRAGEQVVTEGGFALRDQALVEIDSSPTPRVAVAPSAQEQR